jgi:hypothetical protein
VDNPKPEIAPPLGPVVKDSDIVDWNGPDDAQNPRNWANGVKLTHVLLVSAFTLYSYVIFVLLPVLSDSEWPWLTFFS